MINNNHQPKPGDKFTYPSYSGIFTVDSVKDHNGNFYASGPEYNNGQSSIWSHGNPAYKYDWILKKKSIIIITT